MKIANLRADADIVGQRIHVSWDFVLEGLETLADIPLVVVRRKTRDFEFPLPVAGSDPFLLYDSATFPPAPNPPALTVTDLPGWEENDGTTRTVVTVISVATQLNGCPIEAIRRTTSTIFDAAGVPLRKHIDILDTGNLVTGTFPNWLVPDTTYYYQLFSSNILPNADMTSYRATATATRGYGLNRTLYESLPAIYRRHDVTARPAAPGANGIPQSVPEVAPKSGQLRRFLDPFGLALDFMRSTAEGLRNLRDIDNVDYRYLPLLAQWIGWEPSFDANIPLQRNEIKNATRLYRGAGTIPTLRAIVNRYTGWYTQVAEFAQHILRTNQIPQLNIFGIVETPDGWRGSDDATTVLGFGNGHDAATGDSNSPATLIGSLAEPFALRPGMKLSVTADDLLPQVVYFGSGDFANIMAATANEVVAVINRIFSELTAVATTDGRIQLRSETRGLASSLRVNPFATSLITLEGAPQGRLSIFVDTLGRIRLFYETTDPATPTIRHVHYKTFFNGAWGNANTLPGPSHIPQGAPAAVEVSPGQVRVAWIDQPYTEQASIRTMLGTTRLLQSARLIGQRTAPFKISADIRFSLRGNWTPPDTVVLARSDFANPEQATVEEVVDLIKARSTHVTASKQANNALVLETADGGPQARLEIDLRNSIGTQVLGFDMRNNRATGSWSDEIDWRDVENIATVQSGRHADLHMLQDANGTIWLFWATHVNSNWNIVSSRFAGGQWSAPETLADEPGGNREPFAILDPGNHIWLFWSHRQNVGTLEDIWTIRRRVYDPTTTTWGPAIDVTTPPVKALPTDPQPLATDREPAALWQTGPGGNANLRLFFRSNRAGGIDLWSVTLDTNGTPGALTLVAGGRPPTDSAPAPIRLPDGTLLLLYRSDGSVSLAQVAPGIPVIQKTISPSGSNNISWPSAFVPDAGTLRRFTGTTSVVVTDRVRNGQHRLWDDMLAYTPDKPQGGILQNDDLYTRGTIGLYASQSTSDKPLTQQNIDRLHQLLQGFLPINIRAVIILAPFLDSEYIYQPAADIAESYQDKYPHVEYFTGPGDSTAVALPNWVLLRSNTKTNVSANPADLTTLRFRTYFPPPQ